MTLQRYAAHRAVHVGLHLELSSTSITHAEKYIQSPVTIFNNYNKMTILYHYQTTTNRTDQRITVKPFNLAALKVGDFACKIIFAAFILAN